MGALRVVMLGAACAVSLLAWPEAARADRIDGDWCHANGKRLSIAGPRIVTPGGTAMTGEYDRHGFSYVVPPGEPGAGRNMVIAQIDDETMQMGEGTFSRLPEKTEIWRRCGLPVS